MSSDIDCERSPLATAPITRATSLVGWTRSPIRVLTELTDAAHEPAAPCRCARCVILPSLPTAWLTRSSSRVVSLLRSMISLSASEIFPATPTWEIGILTEKSPFRTAVSTVSS